MPHGSKPPVPGSDELLHLIMESSTDIAIFTTDPNGIITSWNTGAERLLGYREEEIVGSTADIIFPPADGGPEAAREERQTALLQNRAEDERWHRRKDGSRFWASGLMMPLADRSAGFVKILRDRTDSHLAEQRLRENEERFRLLATHIPQLVFRSRADGERTWGSPQWIEFTGLSLAESLGFGWLDAVHLEDREATLVAWREAAERGDELYVEHRVRRAADGEYRWHQTRAKPVEVGGENGEWVGTMTDIHDLRNLKDVQQVLLAELQHRTRNLLAVVHAIARQSLRTSATLQLFGAEFESRLRALSRVQALLARVDHHDVDLRDLVSAELAAHANGEIESGRVRMEGPSVTLPPTSAQAIGLALHELATNAVKYGALSKAEGRLDVRWKTEQAGSERRVSLEWVESGVAMPGNASPTRKGYGTELIERALPYQLGASTEFDIEPSGVRCAIAVPLKSTGAEARHG